MGPSFLASPNDFRNNISLFLDLFRRKRIQQTQDLSLVSPITVGVLGFAWAPLPHAADWPAVQSVV